MLRTKDFYFKKIYNTKGEKLGVIEDIYINFYLAQVVGFKMSSVKLFSKNKYISMKEVLDIGKEVIVNKCSEEEGLSFKSIKGMEIIDLKGNLKGNLEDIIIDSQEYSIKGIVLNSGFIDTLTVGKEIILIDNCIMGEDYILYTGENKITFKTMPHNMEKNNEVQNI